MTIDQSLRRDLLKSTAPAKGNGQAAADPSTSIDLDQHLVSSSKQVLLKKIDFQPAERDVSFQLQNLRVKYVPLNPQKKSAASKDSLVKADSMYNNINQICLHFNEDQFGESLYCQAGKTVNFPGRWLHFQHISHYV